MDEKAGVEGPTFVHDGMRVAACSVVSFEYGDIMRAREEIRGPEPGDTAADDCDLHEPEVLNEPVFARTRRPVQKTAEGDP